MSQSPLFRSFPLHHPIPTTQSQTNQTPHSTPRITRKSPTIRTIHQTSTVRNELYLLPPPKRGIFRVLHESGERERSPRVPKPSNGADSRQPSEDAAFTGRNIGPARVNMSCSHSQMLKSNREKQGRDSQPSERTNVHPNLSDIPIPNALRNPQERTVSLSPGWRKPPGESRFCPFLPTTTPPTLPTHPFSKHTKPRDRDPWDSQHY